MKILFIFFLSALTLFASDINHSKIRIIEKIISEVSIKKEKVIWSDNKIILYELKEHKKLKITNNCENATILILEKKENLINICKSKHIFVLKYNLLTEVSQSFGALFWKKGRPNIVILEPRLELGSIEISKNLEPYLEDRIW